MHGNPGVLNHRISQPTNDQDDLTASQPSSPRPSELIISAPLSIPPNWRARPDHFAVSRPRSFLVLAISYQPIAREAASRGTSSVISERKRAAALESGR